ncbi:kinase-like domain-containing protein [Rhizophagus irregularis DAOM 181602=DAOM 197198]|nr:kinase-like domain-containing protein [Rhizophagus irregularis DAOM 181602=DAOM 197198]
MKTIDPGLIPEWIPYNNLQNIKYLTEGGFSEIYTAEWVNNGGYDKWDSKKQQLKRRGESGFVQIAVLKKLENVENANQNWLEEAKSHLNISNKWKENNNSEMENHTSSSKVFTSSKLHQFDNLPEPRNATEEEQEAFHSNKSYDFHIPENIDDFNKLSSKKNSISKTSNIFKDMQNDYKIEAMQQQTMNHQIKDNDEDEMYNNPNLHSEEQDEFELPDNI